MIQRRNSLRIILPVLMSVALGMQGCSMFDRNVMVGRCGSLTPFPLERELRVHLKDQTEIRAFHYKQAPYLLAHSLPPAPATGGTPRDLFIEVYATDPILTIKDRLISFVAEDVGIKVRSINDPLPMLQNPTQSRCQDDTLDDLKRRFERGLMMDFTSDWGLEAYRDFTIPPHIIPRYYLIYSARGRLIRLEESQVLWQGVCAYVGNDPPSNRSTLNALKGALLNAKLIEAADMCVQELTRQFQGN